MPRGLSFGVRYRVLEVSREYIRLCGDDDDPVLYDIALFRMVDGADSPDWVTETHDGAVYKRIRELDKYVWEDFHDRAPSAVEAVKAYLERTGPTRWVGS